MSNALRVLAYKDTGPDTWPYDVFFARRGDDECHDSIEGALALYIDHDLPVPAEGVELVVWRAVTSADEWPMGSLESMVTSAVDVATRPDEYIDDATREQVDACIFDGYVEMWREGCAGDCGENADAHGADLTDLHHLAELTPTAVEQVVRAWAARSRCYWLVPTGDAVALTAEEINEMLEGCGGSHG